ncbi:hypothetical protein FVB9532_01635 [Mesonia oceanica]|uniref:Uncharacterized protein n=1 Tax=Mesonia oceanica TaxID=2687242 RepID=A0AC61YAI4_9FLAO|nr:hypothetical protein FVB9532_01635 [Mesonia oceanica]
MYIVGLLQLKMISKEILKKELDNFPDYMTIDEVVGRLIVLEKRELQMKYDGNLGNISVEELDTEMEKWFKM